MKLTIRKYSKGCHCPLLPSVFNACFLFSFSGVYSDTEGERDAENINTRMAQPHFLCIP